MLTGICNATITPPRSKKSIVNDKRRSFSFCPAGGGSIEEKSREVIEKERFCQNTGYTGEDWVEIGMRGRRGEEGGMEVVVGMEADIYPRQCVTGSAKSAMMNVLAGINPQCTPPLPSSSAVPLPPPTFTLPISPLPSPSFPPLNIARPHTLSKYISFSLSSRYLLSFCYRFSSTSVPLSFLASLLPLRASPCISFGLFLYRASLYRAPARYRPLFYTYTRVYIFTILDLYGVGE